MGAYQRVSCIGDSITIGSRTKLGYPELMALTLSQRTQLHWFPRLFAENGRTTLWVARNVDRWMTVAFNTAVWTLLIGTNDCRGNTLTDETTFELLFSQIVARFEVENLPLVIGTIPPIVHGRGHLPYTEASVDKAKELNSIIRTMPYGKIVELSDLEPALFVDSVHPNLDGCKQIALRFAEAIVSL